VALAIAETLGVPAFASFIVFVAVTVSRGARLDQREDRRPDVLG